MLRLAGCFVCDIQTSFERFKVAQRYRKSIWKIQMKITVVGTGSWGLAIGQVLASNNHQVSFWGRNSSKIESLNETHQSDLLPNVKLNESLKFFDNLSKACQDTELICVVLPSSAIRQISSQLNELNLNPNTRVLSLTKGIEQESLLRMTEILVQDIAWLSSKNCGVLSGPSHAEEVAANIPTSVVIAFHDLSIATEVQELFFTETFRVYTSEDVIGVEISGALKNIIAIATGILDGLGLGDNSKGALICRGLAEISRLGEALGCGVRTFSGLAGMGDLITTCMSQHSRNRHVGFELGKGKSLDSILESMSMVAEGVPTTKSAYQLMLKHDVEMPISQAIYSILYEGVSPQQATQSLMKRDPKIEGF